MGRSGFYRIIGKHHPAGYWGRYGGHGVDSRVNADQTVFKILKANCDKVLGMGLRSSLWREVITASNTARTPNFDPQLDQTTLTNDGFPICSCYRQTNKAPDNKCRSCYGTGVIPGYTKFGFTEYTTAAIDPALTLSNVSLHTDILPHRLQLTAGFTSGTITTADMAVSNPDANVWEYQVESYIRQAAGTSVTVEFSTNSGGTWANISTINAAAHTTGVIRFRITLTRTLVGDRSPWFEILRVRHARMDEPFIRVLKGLPTRTRERGAYGAVDSDGNFRWWTVPLRHFDPTIQQDPDVAIPPETNLIQPKAFIEFLEGAQTGARMDLTSFDYHDPKGIFVSQGFSCRHLQPDEIQSKAF